MSINRYVGYCLVSKYPIRSRNYHGSISDIAGRMLPVFERNDYGDCLCMLDDKWMVDVDTVDVQQFIPDPTNSHSDDPLEEFMRILNNPNIDMSVFEAIFKRK